MPRQPFYTANEVAALFRVSRRTVNRARGDFARLRRVPLETGGEKRGRTLFLGEDVEALQALLEKAALAATAGMELLNKRVA